MEIFKFLRQSDLNKGLEEYRTVAGSILLDVRTEQEYREGHVPGSQNLPLQRIDQVANVVQNKNTPIFVYCLSGARSRQAVIHLKKMGYANAKNIGGISAYHGRLER